MRNLKLDGILIEHDYHNDDIVIRNSNTMTIQRASRFMFETMDPERRQETLLQMVANTMSNQPVTSAVYTPGTVTVNSGGSGGAIGFGNYVRGAIGAPAYVDEFYAQQEEQLQKDLLKTKLFTPEERNELIRVKTMIKGMFQSNRLAEEKTIPFNMDKMVIAGGCFSSIINSEPIYDIDVFLLDDEYNHDLAKGMAKSYESEDPVAVMPRTPVMSSANTLTGYISLSPKKQNNSHVKIGNSNYMDNDKIEQTIFFKHSKMQYITTKYKTREELVNHFDFRHCCVSYDFATDKLYITREVYDLIKKKQLVQNGIKRPALWRYEKFHHRGWKEEIALVDDLMYL
jgi:hypothetical protein